MLKVVRLLGVMGVESLRVHQRPRDRQAAGGRPHGGREVRPLRCAGPRGPYAAGKERRRGVGEEAHGW